VKKFLTVAFLVALVIAGLALVHFSVTDEQKPVHQVQQGSVSVADIGTIDDEPQRTFFPVTKADIVRWLSYLREGVQEYESFTRYVREEVRNAGLTLADVGTSEEELKQLWVKGSKVAANAWLSRLRAGTDQYEPFIAYLRDEIRNGGLTLADIGTSETELNQLQRKGAAKAAQKWLSYLRQDTEYYKSFTAYVREEGQNAGLTLADIGTSEEELTQLQRKGAAKEAMKWLSYLRQGTEYVESFTRYVREEVQNAGLTLADIGTSEEELASFRK
jgi:hypothetical protein